MNQQSAEATLLLPALLLLGLVLLVTFFGVLLLLFLKGYFLRRTKVGEPHKPTPTEDRWYDKPLLPPDDETDEQP